MGCSASVQRVPHKGAAHAAALKALSQVVPSSVPPPEQETDASEGEYRGAVGLRGSSCKHSVMRDTIPIPEEDMRGAALQEEEDEDEVRGTSKDNPMAPAAKVTSTRQLMTSSSVPGSASWKPSSTLYSFFFWFWVPFKSNQPHKGCPYHKMVAGLITKASCDEDKEDSSSKEMWYSWKSVCWQDP